MSFYSVDQSTPRLHRSELAVPGSRPELFEKASTSEADVVFLDCEDAVAPDEKVQARLNIIKSLNEMNWGNKTMMVRINGLDTHYMYRDVVDIVEVVMLTNLRSSWPWRPTQMTWQGSGLSRSGTRSLACLGTSGVSPWPPTAGGTTPCSLTGSTQTACR